MASGGIVHNVESFAQEHPLPTVGIGLVIIVIIFWLFSGGSDKGATTVIQQPDTTADAAGVAAAKISADAQTANAVTAANAQTAIATIAAGVQNSATAAAAQAAIAGANSATAIAQSHDQAASTISGNTTIASEFSALADVLKNYSNNQTNALTHITDGAANIIVNEDNQNSALAKQAAQLYSNNLAVETTAYYDFRSRAVESGHPNVGRYLDAPSVNSGWGMVGLGTQNGGGAGVGGGSTNYNTAVTNAASAVDNKDMNNLISQLTAKIGNGVTFHAGGAN